MQDFGEGRKEKKKKVGVSKTSHQRGLFGKKPRRNSRKCSIINKRLESKTESKSHRYTEESRALSARLHLLESEKAESDSLREEEKMRLLKDPAALASEMKRFKDFRASDKEWHASQVESFGMELGTKALEIRKMKQIGHCQATTTAADATYHEQEVESNGGKACCSEWRGCKGPR